MRVPVWIGKHNLCCKLRWRNTVLAVSDYMPFVKSRLQLTCRLLLVNFCLIFFSLTGQKQDLTEQKILWPISVSVTFHTLFWAILLLGPARYSRWHGGQQRRSSIPVCSGKLPDVTLLGPLILHVQNKTEYTGYIHLIGEDILNLAEFFR